MGVSMFWANILGSQGMLNAGSNAQRHLLALPMRKAKPERANSERWKDQSFPEYIVDVTRNSLLSFTTSLTKVSSEAHDFFARINAMLAFERMMRTCMGWMMPGFAAPSAMDMGMAMGAQMGMAPMGVAPVGMAMPPMWGGANWFGAMPQLMCAPQPKPQPKALSWFGADLLALPKSQQPAPQPKPAPLGAVADLPIYGAMLALPAAFLAMAPAMMQAWNVAV